MSRTLTACACIVLSSVSGAAEHAHPHPHSTPHSNPLAIFSETQTTDKNNCHCGPPKKQAASEPLGSINIGFTAASSYAVGTPTQSEFGYLIQGSHDPTSLGFDFNQAEIAIDGEINRHLAAYGHWAFSDHVETEYAYLHVKELPGAMSIRGIYLPLEIGSNNLQHGHGQTWIDRSLADTRLIGRDTPRSAGLRVGWQLSQQWGLLIGAYANDDDTLSNWRGDGHSHNENDLPHPLGEWGNNRLSDDEQHRLDDLVYLARVDWMQAPWHIGASFTWGENGTGDEEHTWLANTWLMYGSPAWSLHAEGSYRHATTPGDDLRDWGITLTGLYRLRDNLRIGARFELLAGAGDSFGPSPRNEDAARDDRLRFSPLVEWTPWPELRLRAQVNYDDSAYQDEDHVTVLLGAEINLGSHGHAAMY